MLTLVDVLRLSQADHVTRYTVPGDCADYGTKLGAWGSRHAAIRVALCMMQGAVNTLEVTLECPDCERY